MKMLSLHNLIPENIRVCLTDDLRFNIFSKAISNVGDQRALATKLDMSSQNVSEMLHGTVLPTLKTVKIISRLSLVDMQDIYENIEYLTLLRRNGMFFPKLRMEITPEIAEWFGQALGDGGIASNKRYVSFGNNEIDLVKFHLELSKSVFGLKDSQFLLVLRIPKDNSELQDWLDSFRNIKIIYGKPVRRQNKIYADLMLPNKAVATYFDSIKLHIINAINASDKKVKCKFLAGLYAAEGSVQMYEVFFIMKNLRIINNVKMLLNEIGIDTSKIKLRKDGTYDLRISRRANIVKFNNLIKFGKHKTKNERIKNFINGYTELQLSKEKRYDQILFYLKRNSHPTISEISKHLSVTYSLAWLRVKELERMKLIKCIGSMPNMYVPWEER